MKKEFYMLERKELFGWFKSKEEEKKYTFEEVKELVDLICEFNCGAIDYLLTKHAKNSFEKWVEEKKEI